MTVKKILEIMCVLLLISDCFGSSSITKRGVFDNHFGNGFQVNDLNFDQGHHQAFLNPGPLILTKQVVINKGSSPPVSPAEIASAISAAKEASVQVQQAQQRVHVAKESVLNQQRIASQKESQAAIAAQKAEAAAAVQRQEANAAATAVVLAQQRLAQAKSDVAEQQRIAAAKEAHAAHVIHKSASAAAAEIQKSEHTAAKLAALQRSEATAYKQASAAKDATLSAASAAVAASANHYPSGPWAQAVSFHPWHQ